jgi:hypothetical protein
VETEHLKYDTFAQISHSFWEQYLQKVGMLDHGGGISQIDQGFVRPNTLVLLYPTILICTQTDEYFIAELVGSRRNFDQLKLKKQHAASINEYFYQFDVDAADPALIIDNKQFVNLNGFHLSHMVDSEELHQRFPFLAATDAPRIIVGKGTGAVIAIRNRSNFISLQDCVLVNRHSSAIRIKHIHQAVVIHRTTNVREYTGYLNGFRKGNHIYGIQHIKAQDEEAHRVAGQFANLYLFRGLRETTIGEFFRSHPEFIRTALCTSRFEYEPYLEWQEGSSDPHEHAINPDLLIQRLDGHFDIYDLKTSLLDRTSLTKGRISRRRFVDYVAEGAAQLAHYASYFTFPKNREYAHAKYHVSVAEPRLVLVVGNRENINRAHVDQACRMLKNFEIIDYDTLLHLYLNSKFRT